MQLSESRLGSMNCEDPSGPLPQDIALEKFRFLAFFGCDVLPSSLFNRACKPSLRWDNSGELEHEPFIPLSSIISRLPTIIEEGKLRSIIKAEGAPWSKHYTISQEWKERLSSNAPPATCRSMQFAILDMTILAFPTPWTEISWEEVENQLWDVIQSTCVPFLGVLDIGDVMEYMDEVRNFSRERKYLYLAALSKFLLRLSTLLGDSSPPSIPALITDCLQVLQTWPGVEYLYLSKSIAEGQLQNLSHYGSMGLNGTIGLALASFMPPGRARLQSKLQSDAINWAPLCKLGYTAPSTMEILAQVQLFGATSLKDILGVTWNHLSLETKALIAFCETKHKSFENAIEILVQTLPEIEEAYDAKSMEFVLVGTTLINCFNATRREDEGEALARSMCVKAFGWLNSETLADSKTISDSSQHTCFMISMADSFLGQGKYDSAGLLCENVLKYRFVASDVAMSAALRLLKMSRRCGTEPSSSTKDAFVRFDAWKLLREISGRFHEVSDSLKYEFLEETMCFLSVLDSGDTAQTSYASEVVNTLSQYPIGGYKGTTTSEKNFQENLEALHHYKNRLNLFSLSGPSLCFCRKVRDRFPNTTVQLAEKIGLVIWQRIRRIKEMHSLGGTDEEVEVPWFLDSGIGSSIGSSIGSGTSPQGHNIQAPPKVARSVTSIRSFMPLEKEAATLPSVPHEILSGETFTCFICERVIKDVSNRSQWERHIYADLRPYVCIVEGCEVDSVNFASRAEFAAHLTEHQRTHPRDLSRLECPFCNGIPGAVGFVGHVCHHLEELSLSALPQEGSEGEVDDESLIWRSTGDTHNSTQLPFTMGYINLETHDTNFNVSSPTDNPWDQFFEGVSPSTEAGLNNAFDQSNYPGVGEADMSAAHAAAIASSTSAAAPQPTGDSYLFAAPTASNDAASHYSAHGASHNDAWRQWTRAVMTPVPTQDYHLQQKYLNTANTLMSLGGRDGGTQVPGQDGAASVEDASMQGQGQPNTSWPLMLFGIGPEANKEKEDFVPPPPPSPTEVADESSDSDAPSTTSFAQSKGSAAKPSYGAGAPVSETSKQIWNEKIPIAGRMVPPNQDHEIPPVRKRKHGRKSRNSDSHVKRSGNHFGRINLGAGHTTIKGSLGSNFSGQAPNNRSDEISTSHGGPTHSFAGDISNPEMVKPLVDSWGANPIPEKQEAHRDVYHYARG